MKKSRAHIKQISWIELRKEFSDVNAELAKIIDDIDPDKENLSLFVASYPYGEMQLKNGKLYIPDNLGNILPLHHNKIDPKISKELYYGEGTNPVTLILNNSAEMFLEINNYTIPPHGVFGKGRIYNSWRALDGGISQFPPFLWNISGGARSLFMLPKISEKKRHERINKKFNIQSHTPYSLFDHWKIFAELNRSPVFNEPWELRVCFFGKKWFEKFHEHKWVFFKNYLLQAAWGKSEFWRNQFVWDLIFSIVQKEKNLRPDPYVMDTVKNLLSIAAGGVPGFAPAIDNTAAPISTFQEIYLDIYQLNYAPIIMQPAFFSLTAQRPVYYSLEYPSTIEFSPSMRKSSNKIVVLNQIMSLLEITKQALADDRLNIFGTNLHKITEKVSFDFFHGEPQNYEKIRNSEIIPHEDKTFEINLCKNKEFPSNSPFLQGCVRISAISS